MINFGATISFRYVALFTSARPLEVNTLQKAGYKVHEATEKA